MRYFECSENGFLLGVGRGGSRGEEISEERYEAVLSAISRKPPAEGLRDYRLRTDLSWEPFESVPCSLEAELKDEDVLALLSGGAS